VCLVATHVSAYIRRLRRGMRRGLTSVLRDMRLDAFVSSPPRVAMHTTHVSCTNALDTILTSHKSTQVYTSLTQASHTSRHTSHTSRHTSLHESHTSRHTSLTQVTHSSHKLTQVSHKSHSSLHESHTSLTLLSVPLRECTTLKSRAPTRGGD